MSKVTDKELQDIKKAVVEMIQRDFYLTPRNPQFLVEHKIQMITIIAAYVCENERVLFSDLIKKQRTAEENLARQIICYMTRHFFNTGISFSEIGKIFNRNHATILHAVRVIKNQMDVNKRLKEKIERYVSDFYFIHKENIDKYKKLILL